MRKLFVFLLSAFLAACGSSSGSNTDPVGDATACGNDGQKQFVLDNLYHWYLWNDLLPANLSIADYATPEELIVEVTTTYGPQDALGNPIDRWSRVGSAEADTVYYDEGRYEGFGFRWRFEGPDFRIVSVYVDSPAGAGGLERGQTVSTLNGRTPADIDSNEGISAFFSANDTVTFEMTDPGVPPIQITSGVVTIDPIPQVRLIGIGPGLPPVGYIQFETFISTAHDGVPHDGMGNRDFDAVFAQFIAAGVNDVILDLRYNRGGLVDTAELLGDYLGAFANDGLVFSETEYNADRNPEFSDNQRLSFFSRLGNSIDLTRIIVIASKDNTASASELVTNSMEPYADVWIVGENTYGKPAGQIALDFCDKRMRPTSFKVTNADGYGEYFDGLPVDCTAADNLDIPVGDNFDENIIAATTIAATGACPIIPVPMPIGQQAPVVRPEIRYPELTGPPEQEFAGSF